VGLPSDAIPFFCVRYIASLVGNNISTFLGALKTGFLQNAVRVSSGGIFYFGNIFEDMTIFFREFSVTKN
jgi:hypothetical protein